ncbi:MAG: phosphoribosyltransferase family protein [Planctomycetota bacterium]
MRVLADAAAVRRHIDELTAWADRLRQDPYGAELAVVGVRSRGDVLARRVAERLGIADVGVLDITLYRDDLSEATTRPVVRTTEIDFALDGRVVVLIDDVLMTGRSVRAALASLMDLGRPRRVWLAVMVDRGLSVRELPIAADFAAMTEDGPGRVQVELTPTDDADRVVLVEDGDR